MEILIQLYARSRSFLLNNAQNKSSMKDALLSQLNLSDSQFFFALRMRDEKESNKCIK